MWSLDGRQPRFRRCFSDVQDCLADDSLLGVELCYRVHVLKRAAAADAKIAACWYDTFRRRFQNLGQLCNVVLFLAPAIAKADQLARQSALDEYRLAIHTGYASAIMTERLDARADWR